MGDIYDILTTCRAFFPNDYDEKYKIKERRKKRPVSDSFFNFLESDNLENLSAKKYEMFKDNEISTDEYNTRVAQLFHKEEILDEKLREMETKLVPAPLDPKFNHLVLSSWYPGLGPNDIGRLFGKLKSRHSGSGPESWSLWIRDTDLATIEQEAKQCKSQFLK